MGFFKSAGGGETSVSVQTAGRYVVIDSGQCPAILTREETTHLCVILNEAVNALDKEAASPQTSIHWLDTPTERHRRARESREERAEREERERAEQSPTERATAVPLTEIPLESGGRVYDVHSAYPANLATAVPSEGWDTCKPMSDSFAAYVGKKVVCPHDWRTDSAVKDGLIVDGTETVCALCGVSK